MYYQGWIQHDSVVGGGGGEGAWPTLVLNAISYSAMHPELPGTYLSAAFDDILLLTAGTEITCISLSFC